MAKTKKTIVSRIISRTAEEFMMPLMLGEEATLAAVDQELNEFYERLYYALGFPKDTYSGVFTPYNDNTTLLMPRVVRSGDTAVLQWKGESLKLDLPDEPSGDIVKGIRVSFQNQDTGYLEPHLTFQVTSGSKVETAAFAVSLPEDVKPEEFMTTAGVSMASAVDLIAPLNPTSGCRMVKYKEKDTHVDESKQYPCFGFVVRNSTQQAGQFYAVAAFMDGEEKRSAYVHQSQVNVLNSGKIEVTGENTCKLMITNCKAKLILSAANMASKAA